MEVGGDFSPSILPKNAHFFMICTINHQPFVFGGSSISIAMVTILRSHCKLGLVMWSDTTSAPFGLVGDPCPCPSSMGYTGEPWKP